MTDKSKKYRRCGEAVKATNEGGDVTIQGWANKAVVDDMGDLMKFDNVDLQRFEKNPIMFFNHDRNFPIGKWTEWKITEEGLWVKGVISKSADRALSYIRDLIQEGILKTLSIGFDPKEETYNRAAGHNEIGNWRLNEVSVVTLPANIEAEFSLAKALGEAPTLDAAREAVLKALGEEKAANKPQGEDPVEPKKPEEAPAEGNPTEEPPANKADGETDPEKPAEPTPEEMHKNAFQDCVSAKIPKLLEDGKSQDQAVATAIAMCTEEGKCKLEFLSKENIDFARSVASKACEPKTPEEKSKEDPATPVPQPTDDPSNFGSPEIEIMKTGIALLGKIAIQLETMTASLERLGERLENGGETSQNSSSTSEPSQTDTSEEMRQKDLAEISGIRERLCGIAKDLDL
jgi:HK97 family phage prohead protease